MTSGPQIPAGVESGCYVRLTGGRGTVRVHRVHPSREFAEAFNDRGFLFHVFPQMIEEES